MSILGRMRQHKAWSVIAISMVVVLAASLHVLAAGYGSDAYGTCGYGQACPPSTVVTLPSGPATSTAPAAPALRVNINLKDGQVIPRAGYTIIVTPLNGQGASFASVDFYVNGTLVHSQTPDEEGTVSWPWDVSQFPGTTVKIVVNGQDGQTVSQSFNVRLAAAKTTPAVNRQPATASTAPSALEQIISAPRHLLQSVTRGVAKLPRQVKYSLPYFLFIILGVDVVILLIRSRHEVLEARRLQALLAREQQTGELKHTFLQLISHYLRTPLTIISGGVELSSSQDAAGPAKSTHRDILLLNATIDDLLEQLSKKNSAVTPAVAIPVTVSSPWRQANFYIPTGLIGVVAICFDYLVHHGGSFDVGQINLIVQLVVFGSLSVIIYQALRYRQLKQREQQVTTHILDQEVVFNQERDQVISYGATQIKSLVDKITDEVAQVQEPDAKRIAGTGVVKMQAVTSKLLVANELKGSRSKQLYTAVSLDDLVHRALGSQQQEQLAQKALRLQTLHSPIIQVQNSDLLVFVLRTILDNAIAYSPQNGAIDVDAVLSPETASISVRDQGSGIPEDKKFALFQAFSKVEGAETFDHEGMGFSLYLDKLIMNYLVGSITIESAADQGTTAVLTLPQPLKTP